MTEKQLAILGVKAITKVDKDTAESYPLFIVNLKDGKDRRVAFSRSEPTSKGAFVTIYDKGEAIPWGKPGEKFKSEFTNIEFFTDAETLRHSAEFDAVVEDIFGDAE